ncbi:hypothetical protein [Bacillus sp. JS]|uniref:hypothetical protein n=1 Tax=Bacillus sp. JS TaxID=1127744 RepID=UPI000259773A|nr:hypothetical protein [Bacillus sp. JS]AFI27052.1 hypothetical protein MY9_0513 [Bacillus sp. JS]MCY8187663.1 hypothetical protein [Bacillus spizizenii]MCY9242981.1 hypothetical protein [Bacillus spizizenii]
MGFENFSEGKIIEEFLIRRERIEEYNQEQFEIKKKIIDEEVSLKEIILTYLEPEERRQEIIENCPSQKLRDDLEDIHKNWNSDLDIERLKKFMDAAHHQINEVKEKYESSGVKRIYKKLFGG